MACYGGGHVQSLIPVAQALSGESEVDLTVIGFTTARAAFERAGITAHGYNELEAYLDKPCPELLAPLISEVGHPDITPAETHAYFHVGLHDLIEEHGREQAISLVREYGRSRFLPIHTFTRYLKERPPHLVITSTSPRSELALQRAARNLGIPGLAVSDLFLQHEAGYLCDGQYAKHITVIADYVAQLLIKERCSESQLYITGNPAFDGLFRKEAQEAGALLRTRCNIKSNERLITWIGTPADISLRGKPFVSNSAVIDHLESYCMANPGNRFAFRPHPNRPVTLPDGVTSGTLLDGRYSIEDVLWASDVVLLETSTVGLQAALIGKPVITIAAENYPPYAALGLATDIPNLAGIDAVLSNTISPELGKLGPEGLGDAKQRVSEVVRAILGRPLQSESGDSL